MISMLLEDNLPPSLEGVPRDLPLLEPTAPRAVPRAAAPEPEPSAMQREAETIPNALAPRSIFDKDEFDVLSRGTLDRSRISRGKR
jgi:hypothetical protein